jgi:anaerobic sulfite reductase subunit C
MSGEWADPVRLSRMGIIEQRQEGLFAVRLHTVAGDLSAEQLKRIAEVAQKYGRGQIHLSTRQGIELHFVEKMFLESAKRELEAAGIDTGASGATVQIVTGCSGNGTCKRGMIETIEIAHRLDETYFRRGMSHRFRISVSGCQNDCATTALNDIGVMGGVEPRWQKSECFNCGACVYACPVGAIIPVDGEYTIDRRICINCGTCVSSCPNAAWTAGRRGYMLWIGGTGGKRPRLATRIPGVFGKDDLFSMIARAIEYYRANGRDTEGFGQMIDRVGVETVVAEILEG